MPPKPFDALRYLSRRYAGRRPSPIRKIVQEGLATPGMLSLAGGLPNPACFPFVGLEATLRGGEKLTLSQPLVNQALQYSASYGIPPLLKQLEAMQQRMHSPQVDVRICVEGGSQSLLNRALDMLLDPGDSLLLESPTYPGTLSLLQPIDPKFVPIETDGSGLVPSSLRAVLDGWDESKGKKPKVLYTIPVGQNPSGATLTEPRRREVYAIAQQHDLVIIEDDPYYFLYLGPPGAGPAARAPPPSLLSMDTDGRVIRFDSFSKVLSSGFRLGFVTGNPTLVEKIQVDVQGTSLHTSGVSQALVAALLERWGEDGWDEQVAKVKEFYSGRRDVFLSLCDKHLTGAADWDAPEAGMFGWLGLRGIEDSMELIEKRAKEEKVLLVPGSAFIPGGGPSNRVRASFSLAPDDEIDEVLRRLRRLVDKANS